jgi:hypothetical protein
MITQYFDEINHNNQIKNLKDIMVFNTFCLHTTIDRPTTDLTTRVSVDFRTVLCEDYDSTLYLFRGDERFSR